MSVIISDILLKIKLKSLKKRKKEKYTEIATTKPNLLSKVGDIEDIERSFFIEIDKEIRKIERLIEFKKIVKIK